MFRTKRAFAATFLATLAVFASLGASRATDANPFAPGWVLQSEASALRFQSVKKETVVELSSFATFSGQIDADGTATVSVLLDSVDTKVDLRNVRMRFLFFETFKFPQATIKLRVAPAMVADLAQVRRKIVTLPYMMDLHGITQERSAEVAITLVSDDLVAVSSSTPISIPVADFGLDAGLEKLQEAANVTIVPSGTVSFDFIFKRAGHGSGVAAVAAAAPAAPAKPASAALESDGDFSDEACRGRFEILSRTGNIFFATGSARLDAESAPLLNSLVDIIQRCPKLIVQVEGHTDADGSTSANQRLSERRAASVVEFLVAKGITRGRIPAIGYGEANPIADNATRSGRAKNRRIEFTAKGG